MYANVCVCVCVCVCMTDSRSGIDIACLFQQFLGLSLPDSFSLVGTYTHTRQMSTLKDKLQKCEKDRRECITSVCERVCVYVCVCVCM